MGALAAVSLRWPSFVEELSRACGGIALAFAGTGLGFRLFFRFRGPKQKYLPDIASGKKLAAFGLTEADAGSDAAGIRTTAVLDAGDSYVLNGTKQWITNGGEADIYTVVACTNRSKGARGFSAFIVEGNSGFFLRKKEDKMGIRASCTRAYFEDCRIPKENLLARRAWVLLSNENLGQGPALVLLPGTG